MGLNSKRVEELTARVRVPKFKLGQLVREPHGNVGVVDAIFADLYAESDKSCQLRSAVNNWYAIQSIKPKTPKEGVWYSVILHDGAVLAGEDDLVEVVS